MSKLFTLYVKSTCIFIALIFLSIIDLHAKPADFDLFTPTGNVIIGINLPTLEWEDTSDGQSFTFTVYYSSFSDFSLMVSSSGIPSSTTHYTVAAALTENATYWWNVYAENAGSERTYASTQTFRVNTYNESPTGCVQISPIDDAVVLTTRPTFYWEKALDPDPGDTFEYKPHVSLDPDIQSWVGVGWYSEQYNWMIPLGAELDENARYYWFVRVRDQDSELWPQLGYPWTGVDIKTFWVNNIPEYPTAPGLSTPNNGAQLDSFDAPSGKPTFTWSASTDPDPLETITYTVRYSSNSTDFNNGIYTTSTTENTSATADNTLIDNVTYWWSVMAVDNSSVTLQAFSSTRTFVMSWIEEPPNAFDLLLPADTTDSYDLTPTLTWEAATDPDPEDTEVWYRLRYSNDPNLASYTDVADITTTSYTFPAILTLHLTYYWVIRAYGRYDGAQYYTVSNSTFSFYTENNPPDPFNLVLSSGIISTANVNLEWTTSTDPDAAYGDTVSYTVYVATALAYLGTPSATSYTGISATNYIAAGLPENVTHYWTVRAIDTNNYWTGTSTWTFQVNAVNEAPLAFSLLSPSGIVNDATPTFDWEDAVDPDPGDSFTYTIEYDTQINFATAVSSAGLAISSYTPSVPLNEDITYWWRVTCIDVKSSQTVSNTWTTIINAVNQAPAGFNLLLPANGSISPTRYPIFIWDPSTDGDPGDQLYYTIYYSTSSSFVTYISSAGLLNASHTPQVELIENATYYWYVKVQDMAGAPAFSASTWTVLINGTNEYPVTFNLLSPASGALSTNRKLSFDWEDTYDPDPGGGVTYRLHYSKFSDFSSSTTITGITASTYTFTSDLDDNSIYYWKVEARDNTGNARVSTQTSWYVTINVANDPPQAFDLISPVNGTVVTTDKPLFDWEDAIDLDPSATVTYRLKYSPDPTFTVLTTEMTPIPASSFPAVVSLLEETTYYWIVFASDGQYEIQADSTGTFYVEAHNSAPAAFNLVSPDNGTVFKTRSISFDWEDSGDSDVGDTLAYQLVIADNKTFTSARTISDISSSQHTVSDGFYENKVYYWKIVASDSKGATRDSDQTWNFYLPIIDIPESTKNLTGDLSSDFDRFIVYWDDVLKNVDGSDYVDPGGYNIYRSLQLRDITSTAVYAHVDQGVQFFEDTGINRGLYYYLIRTVDSSGFESENSEIISSSPEGSTIILSQDGNVYFMVFSSGDDDPVNGYRFEIEHVAEDEGGRILGSYRVKAYLRNTNQEVEKPNMRMSSQINFYYTSIVQQAVQRSPNLHMTSEDTGIFWHNGVEYVKCGGRINSSLGILTLQTRRVGSYRIQQVFRANSFALTHIWPRKVFTPNGDGINDEVNFNFENPWESVVTGKIFDITGAFVAHMTQGINSTWSLQWDGKDSSGSYVEKGVYIYQIEVEGKVYDGTVIVAR